MKKGDIAERIARGWDKLSDSYQAHHRISTYDVHYGPLAHGERRLRLLGNVRDPRALEIGCGGGQNAIALARQGATAFGVDPSAKQIEYARRLAKECGMKAKFDIASAEKLSMFRDGYFDLALSSHAFGYVEELNKAYREAYRVLKPSGLFVLCMGNPFYMITAYHLSGNKMESVDDDYLSWPNVEKWHWEYEGQPPVEMNGYSRTLSQMINSLLETGFALERLVEQGVEDMLHMSEKEKAALPYLCRWSEEEFAPARKLPYSLVLKLRKQAPKSARTRFGSSAAQRHRIPQPRGHTHDSGENSSRTLSLDNTRGT